MTLIPMSLIPDALVEASGKAIHNRFVFGNDAWEGLGPLGRKYWIGWGRDALAAALATGDVQQEWRMVYRQGPEGPVKEWGLYSAQDSALFHAERIHNRPLIYGDGSTFVTTAWVESRLHVAFPDGSQWISAWQEVTEDGPTQSV